MDLRTQQAIAALAERQLGLFTTWQALAAGVTRRQLQHGVDSGRWRRLFHGVYVVAGAPASPLRRLLAHVLAAGPEGVASHRAAAAVWGVPGFDLRAIEVSKRRGRSQRLADGRVHGSLHLPAHHVTVHRDIPVTTPARMLFDVAGWLHPSRVERAWDSSISLGLTTTTALAAMTAELGRRGRRGTVLARKLCEARGVGYVAPESELEALVLTVLGQFHVPLPRRQVVLGDDEGIIGRVDFVYWDECVVVEADGVRWHSTKLAREADAVRDARLRAAGWMVVRVTWDELVNRPHEFVARLRDALRRGRAAA